MAQQFLPFEQLFPVKTDETGIIFDIEANNFDSIILYNNDSIIQVLYSSNNQYTYICENEPFAHMSFVLVAVNECSEDSVAKMFGCGGLSSINDLNSSNWKTSPNPTNNYILITSNDNIKFTSSLLDLSGREIIKRTSDARIDLRNLEKGIYFVVIYDKNGNAIGQKKVLKN